MHRGFVGMFLFQVNCIAWRLKGKRMKGGYSVEAHLHRRPVDKNTADDVAQIS